MQLQDETSGIGPTPVGQTIHRVALSIAGRSWLELVSLAAATSIAAACVAFVIYSSAPWVLMPADILSWAEGGFVGDVIKLLTGVPFYMPPQDSNSMIYTPGAPWLTFVLLTVFRQPVSVPTLRVVQVIFVVLAALVAAYNTRVMRRMILPGRRISYKFAWSVLGILLLILAATSPRVNRLVLTLHADGLALLASMVFWWALLRYVEDPSNRRLLVLALMPACGFAVKPFLLAWLPVTVTVLALLPRQDIRRDIARLFFYGLMASFAALGLIGLFYVWWGRNFVFWIFDVMGGTRKQITLAGEYNISLARGVDHLLRAWWEMSLGAVGFWLTVRFRPDRRMTALFVGWLVMIAAEAVTSGSGWNVLYHFGPSVLIGVTWLVAVLPVAFQFFDGVSRESDLPALEKRMINAGVFVASILSICIALHGLPSRDKMEGRWFPGVRPSEALYSQIHGIEREFKGLKPEDILLDVGSWVYLESRYVARDRAVSLADQPANGRFENFEPFLERIRQERYKKILLHDFHEPKFLYDYWLWQRPSGVRQALMEHYKEVRTIPAASDDMHDVFTGAVSVLVPKDTL